MVISVRGLVLSAVLLLLLFQFVAHAQETDSTVNQFQVFAAKEWNRLTEDSKTFLVMGYITGYQDGRDDWSQCLPKKVYRSPLLSVGEWIAGVERFYANPKNAEIAFPDVMRWIRLKAEGGKAEELDRLEKELRSIADIGHTQP